MEEKEKIIENIRYLIEKSEYFTRLKYEESFLFEELKKIKKNDLNELMENYKGKEKINEIRYLSIKSILENELTLEKFEKIKEDTKSKYKKNILQGGGGDFGILYVLFFNPIKEKVKKNLKEISNFISSNLKLKFKIKNIDFSGSRNQGRESCWIAFYNPKYKSQSEGYQYALDLNINDLHYGVYHHKKNKEIFEETFNKEEINEKLLEKIIKNLKEYSYIVLEEEKEVVVNKNKISLNQILYGPPGTGKTYNTINKALEIIDNKFYLENQDNREILKNKFEEYNGNGQIEFITFHQSYGYEEFVEGIRAIPKGKIGNDTDEMIYDVTDGIFKELANRSKEIKYINKLEDFVFSKNRIFKISLGSVYDSGIKDWCLENNYISIELGHDINFSKTYNGDNWNKFKDEVKVLLENKIPEDKIKFTLQAMYTFKNSMKIGDLVFISNGNSKIAAIGQIVGNYEFDDNSEIEYSQFRKVKWIIKDVNIPIEKVYNKKLNWKPIYEMVKSSINRKNLESFIYNKKEKENYVLIIDEINRGNISKIFGELITLIETNKRLGNKEALEITLPYSGDKFSVPKNLYILGTMNTADRSIALMDTALRRRFDFEEMMPKHDLDTISTDIKGINLQEVLRVINQRIEYLYDRDHMIGHAYFIEIKTKEQLDSIMRNKIIPLLQEYFYDDWEKIQIVLGDHKGQENGILLDLKDRFIVANELKEEIILGFDHDDIEGESISYTINSEFTENSYIKIYKKLEKNTKEKKDE